MPGSVPLRQRFQRAEESLGLCLSLWEVQGRKAVIVSCSEFLKDLC